MPADLLKHDFAEALVAAPNDAVGRLLFNVLAMVAQFSVIWTRRDACLPNVGAAA